MDAVGGVVDAASWYTLLDCDHGFMQSQLCDSETKFSHIAKAEIGLGSTEHLRLPCDVSFFG